MEEAVRMPNTASLSIFNVLLFFLKKFFLTKIKPTVCFTEVLFVRPKNLTKGGRNLFRQYFPSKF